MCCQQHLIIFHITYLLIVLHIFLSLLDIFICYTFLILLIRYIFYYILISIILFCKRHFLQQYIDFATLKYWSSTSRKHIYSFIGHHLFLFFLLLMILICYNYIPSQIFIIQIATTLSQSHRSLNRYNSRPITISCFHLPQFKTRILILYLSYLISLF